MQLLGHDVEFFFSEKTQQTKFLLKALKSMPGRTLLQRAERVRIHSLLVMTPLLSTHSSTPQEQLETQRVLC